MTAVRLPMLIVLLGPVATATAATSLCAPSAARTRIPLPALDRRHLCDAAKPRFADVACRFTAPRHAPV